jgi:hypothetical protein
MKKRNAYLNHEISEDQWFEWLHEYYRNQIGQKDATSFDIGGYTGAWGNAGRLAYLH